MYKNAFLYEKTHRYLKNDYRLFDAFKTKDRKVRGNCNLLSKVKFHELALISPLSQDKGLRFSQQITEAATRWVLWKKVFLEISQNSRLWHRCFPVNFVKFQRTSFYRTPLDYCFLNYFFKKKLVSKSYLHIGIFENVIWENTSYKFKTNTQTN